MTRKKIINWDDLTDEQKNNLEMQIRNEFEQTGQRMKKDLQEFYRQGYMFPLDINPNEMTLEDRWEKAMDIMGKRTVTYDKPNVYRPYNPLKNQYERVKLNERGQLQGKKHKKKKSKKQKKKEARQNNQITIIDDQQKGNIREPDDLYVPQVVKRKVNVTQKDLLGDLYNSSTTEDEYIPEKPILKTNNDLFDYLNLKKKSTTNLKKKSKSMKKKNIRDSIEKTLLASLYKTPEHQQKEMFCKFFLQGKKCPIENCPYAHTFIALRNVDCLFPRCRKVIFDEETNTYKNVDDEDIKRICPYHHLNETDKNYDERLKYLKNDVLTKKKDVKIKRKDKRKTSGKKQKKSVKKVQRN